MTFSARTGLTALAAAAAMTGQAGAVEKGEILSTYGDIAHAAYEDSLITAKRLGDAVDALIASPSPAALEAARAAWKQARVPYMQTEVYRFGNPVVDAWEGKVNAWPLDEGLIDYVDASYGGATDANPSAVLNVIASPEITVAGRAVDAGEITPALLSDVLQEADEVEANVATGYHAVEFLLWGQDLNGTGPGAGDRPWTDFAAGDDCTNGNCDRRAAYLKAASDLLISDLAWVVAAWEPGGEARMVIESDEDAGVAAIFTGMGSLSYGELAGERMRLGLMLNDPEEEHDCFSDNTHNSHYYDGLGVRNVYEGRYARIDGTIVSGPSVSALVAENDAAADEALRERLDRSVAALGAVKSVAEAGHAYDQMLGAGDAAGENLVMAAVQALIDQTRAIERAVSAVSLQPVSIEGSDSLDNPNAVFQ